MNTWPDIKTLDLKQISVQKMTGDEVFRGIADVDTFTVLDFWRWSNSDLVSNTSRGILAEYIVGKALSCDLGVRDEWATYDLLTPEGYRIEVKSSAFVQSWQQKRLSTITFSCAKRRGWDSPSGMQDAEPRRHSDAYVFALLAHPDKKTVDPLDLSQWQFYAVPTAWLDERKRSQHSITLPSLKRTFNCLTFATLKAEVAAAVDRHRQSRERGNETSLEG